MDLIELLRTAVQQGASDLHITVGVPPIIRVDGSIKPISPEAPKITPDLAKAMVYSILNDLQKRQFEEEWDLDFSIGISKLGRFRVNAHLQRGTVAAAFRYISSDIRSLEELGLPPVAGELALKQKGLILVTGATGSGKSTTLASMLDVINSTYPCHIITIEDPIEYLHHHKKSVVEQREIGEDTRSFPVALRHALRQDPDVILIGELRDLDTIAAALTAAETGHLVLTTLHTNDVVQTIDRLIDVFPPYQQQQVRVQLASVIQGILCQQLVPRLSGEGRVVSTEVLVATPAVRALIRENKGHQIYSVLETGRALKMQTMDHALSELYNRRIISKSELLSRTVKPDVVEKLTKISFSR